VLVEREGVRERGAPDRRRLVDAAIVGGVDSLCLTTLYGFNSLELLSSEVCRPWDAQRRGLSIGEGAAFALLERDDDGAARLAARRRREQRRLPHEHAASGRRRRDRGDAGGAGGRGARPDDIGYINLHGTATPSNDTTEDRAVGSVFGPQTPCSSTKGGDRPHARRGRRRRSGDLSAGAARRSAAGGLERAATDPALGLNYLHRNRQAPLRAVLSNSFGFGGTNASLILGRAA
jgi:3-oxoacyl-[acyl-carrier-protein] synthase-1